MKTSRLAFIYSFILLFFFLTSCSYGLHQILYRSNSVSVRSKKIVDLPDKKLPNIPETGEYTFIVLTDVHYGANKKRYDDKFLKRLTELKNKNTLPSFFLVLGDIVEHGKKDEYELYNNFVRKIQKICNVPVYGIVGNHDLHNSGWIHWKNYVFPHEPYYRFKTKKFSWYFIDTGDGTLGESQLENLVQELNKDPNPKFIFSHYALYGGGIPYFVLSNTKERSILIDSFAKNNVKMFFAGHYHPGRPIYSFGHFEELVIKGFVDYGSWIEVSMNENKPSFSWVMY